MEHDLDSLSGPRQLDAFVNLIQRKNMGNELLCRECRGYGQLECPLRLAVGLSLIHILQLSHGGMYGGLASVGGDVDTCSVAYGPSEMSMPAGEVKEMPRDLIYEIIESYGKAARLCKETGFDMVQVLSLIHI